MNMSEVAKEIREETEDLRAKRYVEAALQSTAELRNLADSRPAPLFWFLTGAVTKAE